MTTRTTEQHTEPSPRRSPWLWGTAVAVVAVAVVVAMMSFTGHAGNGDGAAAPGTATGSAERGYDLSSPASAAKSFASAARTGSGDTLLGLTCVGRLACVREHAAGASEPQVEEARNTIREGVFELAEHLKGVEFTAAVDGEEPGTKNVPYRTPAMTGDAYLSLTFIQSDGDWLYYTPL
ncbi:hypothetical protein [Actinophytocola sp.]|uniref:hypothetical protein n=1 Tax=Actinophytocola sp. TaxID=1872138 RepID=UPI00389A9C50